MIRRLLAWLSADDWPDPPLPDPGLGLLFLIVAGLALCWLTGTWP